MVLTYTQEHVYEHPWDRVTSAAWRKFTDPDTATVLSHILDVHTLSRHLDPVRGVYSSTRSIIVRSPTLPLILRHVAPCPTILCLETSLVDAPRRSMEIVSRNVSLRGLIEVQERSSYRPHPERPEQWTAFRQETSIICKPLAAVASALAENVEHRCAERFKQNSVKGREIIERICKYLEAEGSNN
ncbi:PRELI domain containing protein 3B [Rhynchospora pubera]|uniref:PRELI domain containing protein 3B n=1 Tax=Rhynchospora pubera TaxID=906938 RepID=A0AAV8BWA2_9POAL|nr:PRELI domain containing protein 3B [Rhynchospora pubera]